MESLLNFFYQLYYLIDNWSQSQAAFLVKTLALVISLILTGAIIVLLIKSQIIANQLFKCRSFIEGTRYEKRKTIKIWKKIIKLVSENSELSRKSAILLANKLLEEMLERAGWPGRNLEEKLSKINPAQLPDLEKIRAAHQASLKILKDPDFPLEQKEAISILTIYEKAFKDFGLLN